MTQFIEYRKDHHYGANIAIEISSYTSTEKIIQILCELEEFKYYDLKICNIAKQELNTINPNWRIEFTLSSMQGTYFHIVLDAIRECISRLDKCCMFSIISINITKGIMYDNRLREKESCTSGYY